jgi:hypothetical protein
MWRPLQNPLDKPLEEAIADTIASDVIDGSTHVLDRRDLARRATLEGFRQAIKLVTMVVGEMAADHAQASEQVKAAVLREAVGQVRTLPVEVP